MSTSHVISSETHRVTDTHNRPTTLHGHKVGGKMASNLRHSGPIKASPPTSNKRQEERSIELGYVTEASYRLGQQPGVVNSEWRLLLMETDELYCWPEICGQTMQRHTGEIAGLWYERCRVLYTHIIRLSPALRCFVIVTWPDRRRNGPRQHRHSKKIARTVLRQPRKKTRVDMTRIGFQKFNNAYKKPSYRWGTARRRRASWNLVKFCTNVDDLYLKSSETRLLPIRL